MLLTLMRPCTQLVSAPMVSRMPTRRTLTVVVMAAPTTNVPLAGHVARLPTVPQGPPVWVASAVSMAGAGLAASGRRGNHSNTQACTGFIDIPT